MKKRLFLPLLTYPDASSETMLENAVSLASNLDADLCATAFEISIPPIVNPWPLFVDAKDMIAKAERQSREEGEALVAALRKRCEVAGIIPEVKTSIVSQPDTNDFVTEQARLHDMTLLQAGMPFVEVAEAVIFGSGRPVILYPDNKCSGRIEHVAIAWDGSRAAARAAADAASFIDRAERVSVISVLNEKPIDQNAASQLAAILVSQGVNAEAFVVQRSDRAIGDAIQSKAHELRADLLVMGGYGHSRLREFVLGGATATVLSNPMLPVLMAH